MKRYATVAAVVVITALPARAEESVEEGFNLLGEGAKIIMRSMLDEMEPKLKDLQFELGQVLGEMEPVLRDLSEMIGDIKNYHAPEMLPNGDIIIRRKTPAELAAPEPGEEIEI